jgi:chemotaxis protein CheC
MLGEPQGTITSLGDMERSALAEVGNLLVSSFLSAVVTLISGNTLLRPSPPGIQVDMLGAILPSVVVPLAAQCDDLQIVETVFRDSTNTVEIRLWLLPAPTDHHVTV